MSVKRRYKEGESEVEAAGVPVVGAVKANFVYFLDDQPTVHFFSTSTGPITSHNWDFDDGSANSVAKNPSHTYTIFGGSQTFLVRLTVEPGGVFVEKSLDVMDPTPGPTGLSATALTIEEATEATVMAFTDMDI